MRNRLVLTASVLLVGMSAGSAYAQSYGNGYNSSGEIVRCESRDERTQRCSIDGSEVQLVRQLSGTQCVRGRNWGTDYRGIWVNSGCRAEFRVFSDAYYDDDRYDNRYGSGYGHDQGNDGLFRCESSNNRTERCSSAGGRAQFIRQLSNTPCVRGQSWGSDSRGVWVSNGCRALFRTSYGNGYGNGYGNNHGGHGGSDLIRCESNDNRSHSCAFDGNLRGDIRLLRQLSGKPCIEGQTWGRSRNGVWVTNGCRAEFVIGRGHSGAPRPPGPSGRRPGDLGGVSGASQPGVLQNPLNNRRPRDAQVISGARQAPVVMAVQPAVPANPVERPVDHLTQSSVEQPVVQVEQRTTGGSAQPDSVAPVVAPREAPVSREREPDIQRGERPPH